ncbi:MAG: Crp/Fnr family transcriptional regulator [Polyangiaceae bacterium]
MTTLLSRSEFRRYAKGARIWKLGDADSFIFVFSGTVEVYLAPGEEQEGVGHGRGVTIDILGDGDVLGHSALVGRRHTANVRAKSEAKVVFWSARDVAELMLESPKRTCAALVSACQLIGRLNRELAEHRAGHDIVWRTYHLLLRLLNGATCGKIEVSQRDLTRLVGASESAFSRALGSFRDVGAITGSNPIEVVDLDRARELLKV